MAFVGRFKGAQVGRRIFGRKPISVSVTAELQECALVFICAAVAKAPLIALSDCSAGIPAMQNISRAASHVLTPSGRARCGWVRASEIEHPRLAQTNQPESVRHF